MAGDDARRSSAASTRNSEKTVRHLVQRCDLKVFGLERQDYEWAVQMACYLSLETAATMSDNLLVVLPMGAV